MIITCLSKALQSTLYDTMVSPDARCFSRKKKLLEIQSAALPPPPPPPARWAPRHILFTDVEKYLNIDLLFCMGSYGFCGKMGQQLTEVGFRLEH